MAIWLIDDFLFGQVNWVVRAANVLLPLYAEAQALEMQQRKSRMLETWRQLNETIEKRTKMLQDAEALCKWLADVQHSVSWLSSAHELITSAREAETNALEDDNEG